MIGDGTPAGCTSAAVVQAVAEGGIITFDCGPKPVTITMTATAKVVNTSHQVVLDGGGKVTLSGGGEIRILYMNTCDPAQAIGLGANPAKSGTSGGGSGGAIYTDGNGYNLLIDGTVMSDNTAPEGGGAIFFVVDADGGTLNIDSSTLHDNSSGAFQNAPGIFDEVDSVVTNPAEARLFGQLALARRAASGQLERAWQRLPSTRGERERVAVTVGGVPD